MNFFKIIMSIFCLLFFYNTAFATEEKTIADVKSNLIFQMQEDGYLSKKMASEVAQKYVSAKDAQVSVGVQNGAKVVDLNATSIQPVKAEEIGWTQYLSWINFIKVCAVGLLLFAFSGIIKNIIRISMALILSVPLLIYQAVAIAFTFTATVFPEQIWSSQYFYVALFGAFANIFVLGWIFATHESLQKFIYSLFNLGIPVGSVISFWGMIYFGVLAIVYQSHVFGFFAAVGFSGIFTFSLVYLPGVLALDFKENMMESLIVGHTIAIGAFIALLQGGVAANYIGYFSAGMQYYCTIGLGVALLVATSPYYGKNTAFWFIYFVGLCIGATVVHFFLGLSGMAIILYVFFALNILNWAGYISFHVNWIIGCLVCGGILYGSALVLEQHGAYFLNAMKTLGA